jgi:glutathione S-transferase
VTVRGDPSARAALVRAQGEPPQVPMLVDGDVAVWDRRRIIAYLRETYAGRRGEVSYRDMPSYMGGVCAVDGRGDC